MNHYVSFIINEHCKLVSNFGIKFCFIKTSKIQRPPAFNKHIGLGIDFFRELIGHNEMLPIFEPLFEITGRKKLDRLTTTKKS